VRSGPGGNFYPVLQLRIGDKVEVYHEQNDWCAIRPPIGSFSWVSAQYVQFDSGNIGTVLAEGLASRIGSDYSDDCETVQVTLQKGETLLILERRETPENSVSPVWLKIAPPSGEFRWIHKSALGPTMPIQLVRHEDTEAKVPTLPKIASVNPLSTMRRSAVSTSSADPFQRAFGELQREAYVTMTRPTSDDVFALLIHRAEELYQIAPTDSDLEKTYHLLESLQRTRAVRRELALRRPAAIGTSLPVSPLNPQPVVNSGAPAPRRSVISAYAPTSAQSSSLPFRAGVNVGGYDIVGRLGEFDPPLSADHPPYAVVDERGQIFCLISPSANLELSQYVGQFVGINGVLGYDIERQQGRQPARHITAKSIRTLR